jgi:hypothetical protein
LLVVSKTATIDTRNIAASVLSEAYKPGGRGQIRYKSAYSVIAQKLASYIKQHNSLTTVTSAAEAEMIVFFNLLTYRRILNRNYPFGELFVILNDNLNDNARKGSARVVWRSRGVQAAEDAANDFIKELKLVRAEK